MHNRRFASPRYSAGKANIKIGIGAGHRLNLAAQQDIGSARLVFLRFLEDAVDVAGDRSEIARRLGKRHDRAAWVYEAPRPAMAEVGGRYGFWQDVEVASAYWPRPLRRHTYPPSAQTEGPPGP